MVNTLKQKLLPGYDYLNQAKGTNIDAVLAEKITNLLGSTQAMTAVFDLVTGNIKNYALDNNMEEAIDYVNTQSQSNEMGM